MDIERISKDGLTREAWTVYVAEVEPKVVAKIMYYTCHVRGDRRQKWTLSGYWTPARVIHVDDGPYMSDPPRIPDSEILDALRARMVVEWPEGGQGEGGR